MKKLIRVAIAALTCVISGIGYANLPPDEDHLWIFDNGNMSMPAGQVLSNAPDAYFWVESGSDFDVTVSGLPSGVSYDQSTHSFSGTLAKSGVYYVSIAAQNANGYRHSTVLRWIVGDADVGDYDGIGIESGVLDELDNIWTGQYLEWRCCVAGLCSTPSCSISGIPDGLSWDQSTASLSGVARTPGKYTITLTCDGKKAVKTIVVQDGGSAFVNAFVAEDCGEWGTVSGTGVYSAGETVHVKATPSSGCAFSGWHRDDDRYVSASDYAFVASGFPVGLEARFVPAYDDRLYIFSEDGRRDSIGAVFTYDDSFMPFGVDSASVFTMSVSGLPEGLVYDAEEGVVVGTLAREGVYNVSISATNANGYAFVETMRWYVGEAEDPDYDEIGVDTGVFDGMQTGVWFEWEGPVGVSVAGLPAGLSRNAATGVVSGTPTTPGVYTITFTDSARQKAVKTAVVRDSGSAYLNVIVAYESYGLGTVTGYGVYPIGTPVELNAVAAKDAAFVRWESGCDMPQQSSVTYVMTGYDTVVAYFLSAANDYLRIDSDDVWSYEGDYIDYYSFFGVESATPATVSVSGAPSGLAFDPSSYAFYGTLGRQGTYLVTISATNENGYRTTSVFRWFVGDPETGEFPSTGDYDDIGFDLSAFDNLQTGLWFEWYGPPDVSMSGLPDGLVRNAKTGLVSGAPTKPGLYTITATDASRRKSVRTVKVRDSGLVYVSAYVSGDCQDLGTVSGSGLVAAGGVIKVQAVAAKGAAFAGWYLYDGLLSMDPVFSHTAGIYNESVEARFIAAMDDWLYVYGDDCGFERGVTLDIGSSIYQYFSVDSGSVTTLSVSGLPTGIVYDSATKAISGTPTKDGVYYVTVSATNANGFRNSRTVRWIVGEAWEDDYDNIGLDLSPFDDLYTGRYIEWGLGGVSQVSGLPQGLSYNERTGVVSGMPVKPGKCTFTAADNWQNLAKKTFIVRDSGSAYVAVRVCDGMEDCGEVDGSGVYEFGSDVSISAAVKDGWYFAGWYVDPWCGDHYGNLGLAQWHDPQTEFSLPVEWAGVPFCARFVTAADDYLYVDAAEEWNLSPDEYGNLPSLSGLFNVDSMTQFSVSAVGLPQGLAMFGSQLKVTDTSKLVPGAYNVTLTVETQTGLTESRRVLLLVEFPELVVAAAGTDGSGDPLGTAFGGGFYWPGTQVSLTATPASGAAFSGWYRDGDLISTETSFKYTTTNHDEFLEARFIAAMDDWLYVYGGDCRFERGVPLDYGASFFWYFDVDSGSAVTLSVSGLPTGIAYDSATKAMSGTPTRDGVYYVTVSATNANGFKNSCTVRWFVGDVEETYYDDIGLDLSYFDELSTGMPFEWMCDSDVSVNGLPDGLSYDAQSGLVSGVPTKPGKFTLTFTGPSRTSAVKTIIVGDSGSAYVGVYLGFDSEGLGVAGHSGVYAIGSRVKFSATPSRESCYFAGWYLDYDCGEPVYDADGDWRTAELPIAVLGRMDVFAKFIPAYEDYMWLDVDEEWYVEMDDDGNLVSGELDLMVDSATLPTVVATGLPAGFAVKGASIVVSDASKLVPGVSTVIVSAKNLTGMTDTAELRIRVPNLRSEAFASAGLADAYQFYGGVLSDDMYDVFSFLAYDGWKVTVSGLPPGLKYDARNGILSGAATKAGDYTVYFTATRGKEKQVATATFEVIFPVLSVETGAWGDESASGSVSGAGAYPAGSKVTLKATPGIGCVFAGWFYEDGSPLEGAMDYRTASYAFVTGEDDMTIVALFATEEEDSEICFEIENGESFPTDDDGSFELDVGGLVRSITIPSLSVKGLPSGMKFDAKTNVISGSSKKPGKYLVTVSAKNATVKKAATTTFAIVVPNITSPYLPGLDPDENAYNLAVGVGAPDEVLDLTTEDGWKISGISGLPSGLKYDAKKGTVTGVPSKGGAYTVTVTAKNGKETTSATVTINVAALPDWAQGTFTGLATAMNDEGAEVNGYLTMTVSAAGKISGKISSLDGKSVSFSAASFDVSSGIGRDEDDDWDLLAVAALKSGKSVVDVFISLSRYDAPEGLANAGAYVTSDELFSADLLRTMWRDKSRAEAAKAVLQDMAGVYTVALNTEDTGSGYLSMTLGMDGNLKATGKLPDGTSVSASTPLVYGDEVFKAVINVTPKAYKGGDASIILTFDTDTLTVVADCGNWTSFDPAATSEYGAGFFREIFASGAFYDKGARLSEYYSDLAFRIDAPMLDFMFKYTWYDYDVRKKVSTTDQSFADPVYTVIPAVYVESSAASFKVPKATKPVKDKGTGEWIYDGANDGALTLSFTQATGVFKGSYTFWFDYVSAVDDSTDPMKETFAHTSKKVSFEGVVVQGSDEMCGFYLWDASSSYEDPKTGKQKTYKYKESHAVTLSAQ